MASTYAQINTSYDCGCGYESQTMSRIVTECQVKATLNDIRTDSGDAIE